MKIIIIAAMMTLLVGTQFAQAKKQHDPDKMVERITEKLSLDANQQDSLRLLVEEKQKLRSERKAKRVKSKSATESDEGTGNSGLLVEFAKVDQLTVADMNRILDEKQAKRREDRQPILAAFVNFRNSLTVEQRGQAKRIFRKLLSDVTGSNGKKMKRNHG